MPALTQTPSPAACYRRHWRDEHPEECHTYKVRQQNKQRLAKIQSQQQRRTGYNGKTTLKDAKILALHRSGKSIVDLMLWFNIPESRIREAITRAENL